MWENLATVAVVPSELLNIFDHGIQISIKKWRKKKNFLPKLFLHKYDDEWL